MPWKLQGTPRQRFGSAPLCGRFVAQVELGWQALDACPVDVMDHLFCEDPRINTQLSRGMNYYRETNCPPVEEKSLRKPNLILEYSVAHQFQQSHLLLLLPS